MHWHKQPEGLNVKCAAQRSHMIHFPGKPIGGWNQHEFWVQIAVKVRIPSSIENNNCVKFVKSRKLYDLWF